MAKKRPFIVRILRGIGIFLLAIILLCIIWFTFCFFNRKSSISALPADYSVYVRTDSAWDAVEPLLDLKAADILLADPGFVQFRGLFLKLRETNVRNSKLVSFALSRRIDAGLYANNDYIAIADMGLFSGISRLAPFAYNFFSVKNLYYLKSGEISHFEYRTKDQTIYFKTCKNLVIVASNQELLNKALTFENHLNYTEAEISLLEEKLNQPFRILADPKSIFNEYGTDNEYISAVTSVLSTEDLSAISFGITDNDINIQIKIPFEISADLQQADNPIIKLIQKDSEVPGMLAKLPETVQYYTCITAGSLEELKKAAFQAMASNKDLPKKYQTANNLCQMMFNSSIDDLLFSWTSDEYAVLGLEDKESPVFVLKISDEKKRQEVFDTLLSSIILKSNNSLLLDGIRLPRIEMPSFLHTLLESFGISLPRPYFMVKDDYIYFSQSPEDLASINAALKNGAKLTSNSNWKKVSTNQNAQTSLSLYYNLERSIPFFLKNNNMITKILALYNIGKLDISTKKDNLYITLNSISVENTSTKVIPGFPIVFDSRTTPVLIKSNNEKSKMVFWQEANAVKAINTATLEILTKEIKNLGWIIAAAPDKNSTGEVWAITKDGTIYLLDDKLEICENFPELTGLTPTAAPSLTNDKLLFPASNGSLVLVDVNAQETQIETDISNDIISPVTILDNQAAFYEKGFLGGIHVIHDMNNPESQLFVPTDGIGYGSPALFKLKNKDYLAFITQSGLLSIWEYVENFYKMVENYPVQLDGIFYDNVYAADGNLFVLSSAGSLYKINLTEGITSISIPHLSAKTSYLLPFDYDKDKQTEIFICGDGNTIYGFTQGLEFLHNFPVPGYGKPAFADINADKNFDCLVLTIDNKLNAWKIQ